MIAFSISLPKGTSHERENDMITFNINEHNYKTDAWLAQMELWLCINRETTDTALLQINKDEEFEVHIDSQREHLGEAEVPEMYVPTPAEYEYGILELSHAKDSLPTFSFRSDSYRDTGVGGDLVKVLNYLGKAGWELTNRESENTYIMKKERS